MYLTEQVVSQPVYTLPPISTNSSSACLDIEPGKDGGRMKSRISAQNMQDSLQRHVSNINIKHCNTQRNKAHSTQNQRMEGLFFYSVHPPLHLTSFPGISVGLG